MKNLKKQKGITLVALIITIVVLLILAVVAIGAVKDSDIIGYSKNAAGSFNQAKANEVEDLISYEKTINEYIPKKELTADEKEEIAELLIQCYINRDEETKKSLIEKGVDVNNVIEFCGEDGNTYFYIKDNLDILILAGEDENDEPIANVIDTNTISKSDLNCLYEIAVIVNQQVKTMTSYDDDFIIDYKGEKIEGLYRAAPWVFEYKTYTIYPTYNGDNQDSQGKGDCATLKYVGI